jgi:hypothetical protein
MGLSNRFIASNQAASSGWRRQSARLAFSGSLGGVLMVEETSRLWFKIRFERVRGGPIRATKERMPASERPAWAQKPTMTQARQRGQIATKPT